MKNFWLEKRRKKTIDSVAKAIDLLIKKQLYFIGINGVKPPWQQQKKDTKTQQ
jgi:hypothetical protein